MGPNALQVASSARLPAPDSTSSPSAELQRHECGSTTFSPSGKSQRPASSETRIVRAISVLEHNPLIGGPAKNDLRELIIGHGAHGYIALYRYVPEIDTVFLLAIRSRRQAGDSRL
jgi:hypothetical protein